MSAIAVPDKNETSSKGSIMHKTDPARSIILLKRKNVVFFMNRIKKR
ncbi:MAG: hypothetical protein Q4G10_03155 [Bacteroidia bacterium]|nr:hypothetical protein [Bacteroidia bacterium]